MQWKNVGEPDAETDLQHLFEEYIYAYFLSGWENRSVELFQTRYFIC